MTLPILMGPQMTLVDLSLTLPSMILIGPVGPLEGCQVVVLTYVRVNLLMWLCEISCSSWYYTGILDVIVECWWCLLVLSPF